MRVWKYKELNKEKQISKEEWAKRKWKNREKENVCFR